MHTALVHRSAFDNNSMVSMATQKTKQKNLITVYSLSEIRLWLTKNGLLIGALEINYLKKRAYSLYTAHSELQVNVNWELNRKRLIEYNTDLIRSCMLWLFQANYLKMTYTQPVDDIQTSHNFPTFSSLINNSSSYEFINLQNSL